MLAKVDFESCLKDILVKFGRVDVLINGAGINAPTPILDISEEEWDRIMAVQLKGTLLDAVFGKQMLDQIGSSIINISSLLLGLPYQKHLPILWPRLGLKI